MENQHKKIIGYRDLSQEEIDAMNACKALAEQWDAMISRMWGNTSLDQRGVSIARPTTF